jgi:hypothetical protein
MTLEGHTLDFQGKKIYRLTKKFWEVPITYFPLIKQSSTGSSPPLLPARLAFSTDPTPLFFINFPCGLLTLPNSFPPCSYKAGCFQLVAQSAATCSHWFLTCRFFYLEDGGDMFLQNIGSHKIYRAPQPR